MLLNNVRLNGVRQAGNWDFHIASNQINGQLKWQEATGKDISGKLIARLRSLNILQSSLKQASTEAGKENTYWIPSLDIVTDELTLFEKHLGKTEIVLGITQRIGSYRRVSKSDNNKQDCHYNKQIEPTTSFALRQKSSYYQYCEVNCIYHIIQINYLQYC